MKAQLNRGRPCRALILFGLTLGCWYVLADIRTWGYGAPWDSVIRAAFLFYLLALPVVFLILKPYSPRRIFLAALGVTLFSVFGADAFGRAQEWLLLRAHGKRPDHDLIVQRWPPFRNSNLGYNSTTGWWGCD